MRRQAQQKDCDIPEPNMAVVLMVVEETVRIGLWHPLQGGHFVHRTLNRRDSNAPLGRERTPS